MASRNFSRAPRTVTVTPVIAAVKRFGMSVTVARMVVSDSEICVTSNAVMRCTRSAVRDSSSCSTSSRLRAGTPLRSKANIGASLPANVDSDCSNGARLVSRTIVAASARSVMTCEKSR